MAETQEAPKIDMRQEIIRRQRLEESAKANPLPIGIGDKRPSSPTIHPSRMKLAEYERQEWIANAEFGITPEDLLQPGYWSHMAAQMNVYDHIEVRAEDGAWIAELLVIQVDRNWAKVMIRNIYDLVPADTLPPAVAMHKVEWKGPQHRFCVIRLSDSEIVKGSFQTKDEATSWMKEHERIIAG